MSDWLTYHSLTRHVLVPIWKRVPERLRWRIVGWLNHSDRFCWCDLVDAAMTPADGPDACDGHLPLPDSRDCRESCRWMHDHGQEPCGCYCGKFREGRSA